MKRLLLSAAAACLLAPTFSVAAAEISQDPKLAAKLRAADRWLQTRLEHEAVPGASVAIVYDQTLVWAKGYGVASLETGAPATPETRYSICSISKLFTAIATMQLRDEGKVALDAPLADYVDWFAVKAADGAEEPVTVRGVLTHASGLPRESDYPYWSEVDFPTEDEVRARIGEQTNLYRPYQYFQYSNLGPSLLGEVVQGASGQDFHAYVKAEILDPLDLDHTTSELPNELRGTALAVGYKARNGKGERAPFPAYTLNAIAPAAGFASSAIDLAKFASWQMRLDRKGGSEVLKATTLREMQRVHWMSPDWTDAAWGLGFIIWRHDGKTTVGHDGYCPGYRASLRVGQQAPVGYAVLVNVNDVDPDDVVIALDALLGADIKAAAEAVAAKSKAKTTDKKPNLSQYEGVYRIEGYDWDQYYAPYGDLLISIDLYADDPAGSLTRYKHVSGHVFRRMRDDDTLAEEVRFEVDEAGRPVKVFQHSNPLIRAE